MIIMLGSAQRSFAHWNSGVWCVFAERKKRKIMYMFEIPFLVPTGGNLLEEIFGFPSSEPRTDEGNRQHNLTLHFSFF